ncbi:hypothetical protein ASPWEDRAFT_48446 [Aspergillus wentii DTO 134E9]|uniref:FAD-binding PCMH-type domain-containing protein n=1 Tax=Aspergillus wentii DTO 134E9 TaxID=1073089 RepID=A0A1L9RTA5_ASPWE|nr:uncharacterized protein ASPWEDRAFT_48446 [Aspergillus wentii DTO 134E9]OJJ38088.1 hypothetical protein ASPWEDRAFT_48446 [Aspergillus wentii DTO 134E9]
MTFEPSPRANYEEAVFVGNLLYRLKTPAVVVQAVDEEDVRATIQFAHQQGMQLTVRSGGHSNAAYCMNQGGIVLDMRSMNSVSVNKEDMEISIAGGAIWRDVYNPLHSQSKRLMVMGGQCPTVGVPGFLMGGGLSPLSRSHGLGIDSLLEATVITATGEKLTVSHRDTDDRGDLFWALRGGGGGNFGVVTHFRLKLHKLNDAEGKVVCGSLGWKIPQKEDKFRDMMEKFNTISWPAEVCADALWRYDEHNQLWGELTIIYNGRFPAFKQDIAPLMQFDADKNDFNEMHLYEWEVQDEAFSVFSKIYNHHASFIFPEGAITPEVSDYMTHWMKRVRAEEPDKNKCGCHIPWDHIGAKTTHARSDETAFPWRDGAYVCSFKVSWTNTDLHKTMFNFIEEAKIRMAPHAVGGVAAYVNYIDSTLDTWRESYYGDNYTRLQSINKPCDLQF